MKIKEALEWADEMKPNAFTSKVKLAWLNALEGRIAADVFLMAPAEIAALHYTEEDMETELLVVPPHDDIYTLWLQAKIDASNGEYNKYANSMQIYNEHFGNFLRWFADLYEPAQGFRVMDQWENYPYYITAYGLAVKRGFSGNLDQWLEALKGKSVELRFNEETNTVQWRQEGSETWTDLLDITELQTDVVAETIAQAQTAATAARTAQDAAETARDAAEGAEADANGHAQTAAQNAAQTAQNAKDVAVSAGTAAVAATEAQAAAGAAEERAEEVDQKAKIAENAATEAESWAVGGTGTRDGEDTNNAKFWSKQAQNAAGGGVTSFAGRAGVVAPQEGDYTAAMVGAADRTLSNLDTPQAALRNLGAAVRPNLLVNGRLRVWQRYPDGYSGVPNRIYVPDRFQVQSSNGAVQTVLSKADAYGGIYNESGPSCAVRYYLENADALNGKTLTLSVLRQPSGGSLTVVSKTITASGWGSSVEVLEQFGNDFGFMLPGEKDFYYKLEEGEGQTLGYQDSAGDWHLLPQPDDDSQTQLARCKYFFNRYNYVRSTLMGFGVAFSAGELNLVFRIPPMRTNPAISVSSLSNIKISQGALATGVSPSAISTPYMDGEGNVNLTFTVSGGLTPGAVYRVGLTGGYLDFSAEL